MAYETQVRNQTIRVADGMSSRRGKLSSNFVFNVDNKTLTINDTDYIEPILVINDTRGLILYNPAFRETSGTVTGNVITFNRSTSGMSDADELHVLYEATELNSEAIDAILVELIDQGITLDSTLAELLDQGITLDSSLAELLDQGITLDSTLTELLEQGVVQDSQLAELLAQGSTLDNIEIEQASQGEALDKSENWQDNILSELKKHTKLLTKIYQ